MRKLLLVILLFTVQLNAQSPGVVLLTGNVKIANLVSYDGEAITIGATAIGFTASKISPTCIDCPINTLRATRASCVTETAAFFFRALETGTTPTSTVGKLFPAGTVFNVDGYDNIAAFLAIRTGATSIAMYCTYARPK